jgi:outer membrane protein assembly factor BamB
MLKVMMISSWVFLLCLLLLPVWFLFFSGFRWRTRLAVLAVLILLLTGFIASIDRLEFTGDMRPIFIFRWTQRPGDRVQLPPAGVLPPISLEIDAARDFPRFRGPNADGVVPRVVLNTDWKGSPPRLLWRRAAEGGHSGFAVAGNVAVTLEQRGNREAVACYDRATGQERWSYGYEAFFQEIEPMGGSGPRATPTIADGEVYSLGATGVLVCLDGASGTKKWAANILDDARAKNVKWGMSGSPLVVGEKVVVNPGVDPDDNAGRALVAYDRASGKPAWAAGKNPAGYSSPQLSRLTGRDMILLFDAGGLTGFDPETGKELWPTYAWSTFMGMNTIQPLVLGPDQVLISSELENGCAVVRIKPSGDEFIVEPVWSNKQLGAKFTSPVTVDGCIFGLSNDALVCLDAATGKRHWKGGHYGHGQVLLVGKVLLITGEDGDVTLVSADAGAYHELARMEVFPDRTWNMPALAGNLLFVRNHKEMACYELPLTESK